ncbi:UNVERIFIED_CONTAM: hypothetical protein RMT77_011451 [Armadillidium vulgare]
MARQNLLSFFHCSEIPDHLSGLISLKYDLGRNFIVIGEYPFTLQHLIILNAVKTCFKSKEIIEKIESKRLAASRYNWYDIENDVAEVILTSKVPTHLYEEYRQVIHFVGNEIYEFLFKLKDEVTYIIIFFLKNLVFTWQGTINIIETVLQILILNDEEVSNDDKLKIAMRYFAGKKQVKKCLETIGCSDIKEWAESKILREELQIPIYFWNWLIYDDQGSFKKLQKLMEDRYTNSDEQNTNRLIHASKDNARANDGTNNGSTSTVSHEDSISEDEETLLDTLYLSHNLSNGKDYLFNLDKAFSSVSENDDDNDIDDLNIDLPDEPIRAISPLFENALIKAEINKLCEEEYHCADEEEIEWNFSEGEDQIFNFVFSVMLDNCNEMAVQFLWNNISCIRGKTIDHLEKLIQRRRNDFEFVNIIMFMFTKCSFPTTNTVVFSFFIVRATIKNLRWNKQFLKYYELCKPYFLKSDHLLFLSIIVQKVDNDLNMKRSDVFSKYILKEYLNMMPNIGKRQILYNGKKYFYNTLDIIFSRRDKEACKMLIIGFKNQNIQEFFLEEKNVLLFEKSFKLLEFDFIDYITEELKLSEKDILKLKIDIFKQMAYPTIESLIIRGEYELVKPIVTWSSEFSSVTAIEKEKRKFPYKNDRVVIRELLFKNSGEFERFEQVDEFLSWCFSDNQMMISMFKKEILSVRKSSKFETNFYLDIRELVENSMWNLLRSLFIWSGRTKKELVKLKRKLMNDNAFMHNVFSSRRGGLMFLGKFAYHCYTSVSDRREFDSKILRQNLRFRLLIRNHNFDLIDEILFWCKPENSQLAALREYLWRSTINDLLYSKFEFSEEYFNDYVRWFHLPIWLKMEIMIFIELVRQNRRLIFNRRN